MLLGLSDPGPDVAAVQRGAGMLARAACGPQHLLLELPDRLGGHAVLLEGDHELHRLEVVEHLHRSPR
jgi:hypothetical protein